MDGTKRNNIKLLGTLVNADESGIICSSDQVYDNKTKKSVADSMTDILEQVDNVNKNTHPRILMSEDELNTLIEKGGPFEEGADYMAYEDNN